MTTGKITRYDRARAWHELRIAARAKKTRSLYRAVDKNGLMYAGNSCILVFSKFQVTIH